MSIRTVNLLWEKRIRQTYPVARYALRGDGALALAVPRPLEARAYDRTLFGLDGSVDVGGGFGVETLAKLEVSAASPDCVGMTGDDLYLFHGGAKNRFMGDQRLLYVDMALSETGQNLFTAFTDIAGASYALAYGEIGGRVAWTAEIEGVLTRVAISRLGNRVVVGTEGGLLFLKDASRRDVWEFGAGEPVSALACSRDGVTVAYGTKAGTVGLIDGDGTRLWEAAFKGEISAVALPDAANICAVLYRPHQEPLNTRLACIGENGQVDWEYASEQNLLGLSLSADGKYLATGARNGTVSVYAVVFGEGAGVASSQAGGRAQSQAAILARAGDERGALRVLETALAADPSNLELYDALLAQRDAHHENALGAANALLESGQFHAAINVLDALLRETGHAPQIADALRAARRAQAQDLTEQAHAFIGSEDDERAETLLRHALNVLPYDSRDIRAELGAIRARRSQAQDAIADQLLAEGKLEEGVAALERAQSIAPDPERAQKLLKAQIAMEFGAGMAAYNAKEYRDAIFQFKKALARDPAHSDARRYLSFAQKFATDNSTETLNDRFSRLE